jgi:hypothetical protein
MKKLVYSFLLLFCFTVVLLIACNEDEINIVSAIIGAEGGGYYRL